MHPTDPLRAAQLRAANRRTGLVLAALALTFFVGVIASHYVGGYAVGMSVVGFGVFVFLAFAIGRNLASRR
jgi:hypothetical protein